MVPAGSANVGPSHGVNGFVNGLAGKGLAIDSMGSGVLGGGSSYDGSVGYGGYGGGGGSGGGPGMWRYRKLDMSIFDGSDLDGWLLREERFFAFYKLSEAEMLESVAVALEGDTLCWFQWEQKIHPIRLWIDFKNFVLRQFRPAHGGSLYEQWLSTLQVTDVHDYKRRFIETVARLERVSEHILMVQFLN